MFDDVRDDAARPAFAAEGRAAARRPEERAVGDVDDIDGGIVGDLGTIRARNGRRGGQVRKGVGGPVRTGSVSPTCQEEDDREGSGDEWPPNQR
jgi:hypothetical protein